MSTASAPSPSLSRESLGLGGWLPLDAPAIGALYLVLVSLPLASAFVVGGHDQALAGAAQAVATVVQVGFREEIVRIYVTLTAATLLVGGAMGMGAGLLVRLRDAVHLRESHVGARRWAGLAALVLVTHVLFLAHAVVEHPQAYASGLYNAGGIRRTAEVLLADHVDPWMMDLLGAVLAIAFVLGRPARWLVVARTGASWVARHPWVIFALLGVAALPSLRALRPGRASFAGSRPNILLLASDSLRADRLRPDRMPRLSSLAAKGTTFDRAYTTIPRTFSSWMTLLTGRHVHHHGIRSMFDDYGARARDFDALPERLRAAGYWTGVVSDFAGDIFGMVPLGFQRVSVPRNDFRTVLRNRALLRDVVLLPFLDNRLGRWAFPSLEAADSLTDPKEVAGRAIAELRSVGDQPFFLTVFFSTTHHPYAAPFPFYRRFMPRHYRGAFKYGKEAGLADPGTKGEDDVAAVRALYDGAVASVDEAGGLILDELRRENIEDRTLVVVLADHGEDLYEPQRGFGHGEHLLGDEATHVPLVVMDPRHPGGNREETVVSSVDVAPTLYELAGVAAPADVDGRSLAPALVGGALASRPVFAESELWIADPFLPEELRLPTPPLSRLLFVDREHFDALTLRPDAHDLTLVARHRMVRDDRWKLVYMPTRAGAVEQLFDTQTDPDEQTDVIRTHPEETEKLSTELWRWMGEDPYLKRSRNFLIPGRSAP